jgi:hypothetical protein
MTSTSEGPVRGADDGGKHHGSFGRKNFSFRSETGSASHTASIAVDNVTAEAIRDEDKYGSVRIRLVARLASAREP